jgi:hypothetical protein
MVRKKMAVVSFAWNTLCALVDMKSIALLVFGMHSSLANAMYDAQFALHNVKGSIRRMK